MSAGVVVLSINALGPTITLTLISGDQLEQTTE